MNRMWLCGTGAYCNPSRNIIQHGPNVVNLSQYALLAGSSLVSFGVGTTDAQRFVHYVLSAS